VDKPKPIVFPCGCSIHIQERRGDKWCVVGYGPCSPKIKDNRLDLAEAKAMAQTAFREYESSLKGKK
jgi:hypothetical protein